MLVNVNFPTLSVLTHLQGLVSTLVSKPIFKCNVLYISMKFGGHIMHSIRENFRLKHKLKNLIIVLFTRSKFFRKKFNIPLLPTILLSEYQKYCSQNKNPCSPVYNILKQINSIYIWRGWYSFLCS